MTSHFWTRALLALAVGAAGSWHAARAAELHCRNGDQERRIELSGPDAAPGRACEVRYWRDASAPDSGRVLWYAQQDTDFCAAKARELVARLEAGGWTCAAGPQPAAPEPGATREAALAPPDAPAPTAPEPEAPESAARALEAPEPAAPAPEASEPTGPAPEASEPTGPAPEASGLAAVAPAEPSPPAPGQIETAAPGQPIVPLSTHPAAALLDQVVRETLHSVEELYGGAFQAEHATFGDLDGDGVEDAAVLITYQAERNEYVQYLVAYLFNGETFQSVATRNVGGRFLDALRAELEGIADRRILVELEALDGDAACCATRRAAFALQRGQLVEVADPDGADVEKTSQTERSSPG